MFVTAIIKGVKEKIKNIFSDFRTGVIVLVLALIFSTTARAFALPYKPSDNITDPSCSFGDVDCYVNPLAVGQEVASSTADSVLFVDLDGNLAEDNTNFSFDDEDNKLFVDNIRIPTTDATAAEGVIYKAGSRFIHSFGTDNTFVGANAGNFGLTVVSAIRNTSLGAASLDALTTGDDNVGIGYQALTSNTDGVDNTAVGLNALVFNTSGDANVAIGRLTLQYNATGNYNTAVGTSAFQLKGGGDYNTGIGYSALYGSVTQAAAEYNTALGSYAGASVSTGSRNTFLGAYTDLISATPTLSDSIALGYLAQISASNQFVVGSGTSAITDVYIGEGVTSATPSDVTINATGGGGTDITGADLILAGGKSTGSAYGGDIAFYTSDRGVSGTTAQTLTEKMRLYSNGNLSIGNSNIENYNINFSDTTARMEAVITGYGGETQYKARYANGTQASPTTVVGGDALAVFGIAGYDATDGFTSDVDGGIKFVSTEDWTSTAHGNKMIFAVKATGSDTLTKIMSLDSIGLNVGAFGNHSYTLDVTGDANLSSGSVYRINGTQIAASNLSNGSTGSGAVVLAAGSPVITGNLSLTTATGGIFAVGATAGGTYRTKNTDAATLSTPQVLFDVDTTTGISAGMQSFAFDTTNGFVFTQGNSTRRVARAGINIVSTSDTASAESGDLAFYTKPASNDAMLERFRIDTTGKVGIGDTTPNYLLDVENTGSDTDIFSLTDSDGACLHNPEAGSEVVTCSSDERLKDNITDADSSLDDFMKFKIREYDVIASGDHMTGVIAQEVKEVFPHLVSEGGNGYLMVTSPSTWNIIKAIQELKINIDLISSLDTEEEGSLGSLIKSFLSDAGNTIEVIFAKVIKGQKVETDELCVGSVCVTEDEFIQIFGNGTNNDPINNEEEGGGETEETPDVPEEENGEGETETPPEGENEGEVPPEEQEETDGETPPEEPEISNENGGEPENEAPLQ